MSSRYMVISGSIRKVMLFVFIVVFVGGFITSCGNESELFNSQENEDIGPLNQREFLKQNVAFADARIRSISKTSYVREIVLINFSMERTMPSVFIYDGTTFFDDGSYNDLEANNGIYTSAAEFNHSTIVPYYDNLNVRSVMENIVVDRTFVHNAEIDNTIPSVIKVVVKCDVKFGTCGCRADKWGLCNCCCVTISNCTEIEIEIGW